MIIIQNLTFKPVFWDNLRDYDSLSKWDEKGGNASWATNPNDKWLDGYNFTGTNDTEYIDLLNVLGDIPNFQFEFDFKINTYDDATYRDWLKLIDSSSHALFTAQLKQEDLTISWVDDTDAEQATSTHVKDQWYRLKVIQLLGKVQVWEYNYSTEIWTYLFGASSQTHYLDDMRLGYQGTETIDWHFSYKDLTTKEISV